MEVVLQQVNGGKKIPLAGQVGTFTHKWRQEFGNGMRPPCILSRLNRMRVVYLAENALPRGHASHFSLSDSDRGYYSVRRSSRFLSAQAA